MLIIAVELILVSRGAVAEDNITRANCDHPIIQMDCGMPLLLHFQQIEVAKGLGGIFEAACLGRETKKCKVTEQRPGEICCLGPYRRRLDVLIDGQLRSKMGSMGDADIVGSCNQRPSASTYGIGARHGMAHFISPQ